MPKMNATNNAAAAAAELRTLESRAYTQGGVHSIGSLEVSVGIAGTFYWLAGDRVSTDRALSYLVSIERDEPVTPPSGAEIIKALREGKARDFTAQDWHAWAGASEGSVILDCFPGFEIVVGAENMAIDATNEAGDCFMLTRSGWQTA